MGGRGGAFKHRGARSRVPRGVAAPGVAMPGRPDDYEVLLTIGAGSYGRCCKVRRKADGKVRRRRRGPRPGQRGVALLSVAAGCWRRSEAGGRPESLFPLLQGSGLCASPSLGFFLPPRSWYGKSLTMAR